jgi:hypothetical protein
VTEIEVPGLDWETLVARACSAKHRIIVNYIRHQLTDYEGLISAANTPDEINDLREAVYDAISDVYPELWRECDRQKDAREIDTVLLKIQAEIQAEAAATREALLNEHPELDGEPWLDYLDTGECVWPDMLADLCPDGDYSAVPQYILQRAGLSGELVGNETLPVPAP